MDQNQQNATDNAAADDVGTKPLNKMQLLANLVKVQQQIEAGEVVAFVMLAAHKATDEADENRTISVTAASGDDVIRDYWFAEPLMRTAITLAARAPADDEDEASEEAQERAAA